MTKKSIAILHGKEGAFPYDLLAYIEDNAPKNISVERLDIGAVASSDIFHYDVIIDRISHCIPFYREVMKHAFLYNSYVISNPFRTNPEKFFANTLALRLSIDVPETILLPSKEWPDFVENGDLTNLKYPLDWDELLNKIGFPAVLKPVFGGGWRNVNIVNNKEEFLYYYDKSGKTLMMLQEYIHYSKYIRTFVIGKKYIKHSLFDPGHKQEPSLTPYPKGNISLELQLENKITQDSKRLCQALDYDVNTIEWAIKDGRAYAIDFCNQVPDARQKIINSENYNWLVKNLGDFAIESSLDKCVINTWKSLSEEMLKLLS